MFQHVWMCLRYLVSLSFHIFNLERTHLWDQIHQDIVRLVYKPTKALKFLWGKQLKSKNSAYIIFSTRTSSVFPDSSFSLNRSNSVPPTRTNHWEGSFGDQYRLTGRPPAPYSLQSNSLRRAPTSAPEAAPAFPLSAAVFDDTRARLPKISLEELQKQSGSLPTSADFRLPENELFSTSSFTGPSGTLWEPASGPRNLEQADVSRSESGLWECNRCQKKFAKRSRAIAHKNEHMGFRPFRCNAQCGTTGW